MRLSRGKLNRSAVRLHEAARDREAEATSIAGPAAPKAVERALTFDRRQTRSLVANPKLEPRRRGPRLDRDLPPGRRGLDRVLEHVVEHLAQAFFGGPSRRSAVGAPDEPKPVLSRQRVPCFKLVANELAELDATCRRRACVRARKREETVDQPGESLALCEAPRERALARRP